MYAAQNGSRPVALRDRRERAGRRAIPDVGEESPVVTNGMSHATSRIGLRGMCERRVDSNQAAARAPRRRRPRERPAASRPRPARR